MVVRQGKCLTTRGEPPVIHKLLTILGGVAVAGALSTTPATASADRATAPGPGVRRPGRRVRDFSGVCGEGRQHHSDLRRTDRDRFAVPFQPHRSLQSPRAQVASSTDSRPRNAGRPSAVSSVQAIARSQAGPPTPHVPKSMTAASSPSSSRRFPAAMSPWNQRSTPSRRASSAVCQISRARSTSMWPPSLASARWASSS